MKYFLLLLLSGCAEGVISDPDPPAQGVTPECAGALIFDRVVLIDGGEHVCVWRSPTEIRCDSVWQASLSDATHATVRRVDTSNVRDVCHLRVHSCGLGGLEAHCDPEYVWSVDAGG